MSDSEEKHEPVSDIDTAAADSDEVVHYRGTVKRRNDAL